jgi:hypothetical protein
MVARYQPSSIPIDTALADPTLLGAALGDLSTWRTWFTVLKAAHGRRLTASELATFKTVAGDRVPPRTKVKELVAAVSRRAGKGRMCAALMVHAALMTDAHSRLAPGETGVVAAVSPTREQARILMNYALGYLDANDSLRGKVDSVTADEIRLTNGCVITTLANDYRSLRGRTLLLAVIDEASFLRDESSATPDVECARALLPSLATTNGMLVVMSSPYRRAGLLFQRHRDHFGKDDPRVLVVGGSSRTFNPTLSEMEIAAESAHDPEASRSEWEGLFRSDLSAFLDEALIERALDRDRPLELSYQHGTRCVAFTDMSAGRHDASTLTICHAERANLEHPQIIVDLVRGHLAPHDPARVAKEFAELCRAFNIRRIYGDRFAGEWVAQAYERERVNYIPSELNRSELYLEGLPLFSRGQVRMPEHKILLKELRLLERSTHRSGRDTVDHPRHSYDDFANSLFGALYIAASVKPSVGSMINQDILNRIGPGRETFNQIRSAGSMGDLIRQGRI